MLVASINIDVLFILQDLASRLHSLIILQSTRGVGLQALVNSTICLYILGLQNTLSLTKNYNHLFVYSCKSWSIEYNILSLEDFNATQQIHTSFISIGLEIVDPITL
jgi:hypothetical protein